MINKFRYAVSGSLSVILLPLSIHAFAQPAAFSECQAMEVRQARYDCYDSLDAATGVVREPVPAASDGTPSPRVQGSAARRTQESIQEQAQEKDEPSLFSRIFRRDSENEPAADASAAITNAAQAPPANIDKSQTATRVADSANGQFELIDTVADLDQPAPHVWVITLKGGQTWQQITSKRYNLEKGDEVRIYPTSWGSNYRLSSGKAGGFIQVRRVR